MTSDGVDGGPTPNDNDVPSFYVYKPDTTSCDIEASAKTLNSLIEGAQLTKLVGAKLTGSADPVYTLTYTSAPDKPQTLCYTCDTASEVNYKLRAAQASTAECTIVINVKEKTPPEDPNEDTPPGVEGTKPPTATSGAGATKASAFTAAIGLLWLVSRL